MARFSRASSVLEREVDKNSNVSFVHRQPVEEFLKDPIAEKYGATFVHDLLLASLFFAVVLSPLPINAWQVWVEGEAEGVGRGINVDGALVE